MGKIFGIVNLHGECDLQSLTSNRPAASLAFLGRYAFVDLVLSNYANSGAEELGVLIRNKPRSLLKHFGFERNEWLRNPKTGKMILMYNEKYNRDDDRNTAFNNLLENKWAVKDSRAEYAAISPVNVVVRFNYREMIKRLNKTKADIVVAYTTENVKTRRPSYCHFDSEERLTSIDGDPTGGRLNLHIYLTRRDLLLDAINNPAKYAIDAQGAIKSKEIKIVGYEYRGYAKFIESAADYYRVSLELLNPQERAKLLSPSWPIFTRTFNTPPTYYEKGAVVRNSLVSNGGTIYGTIINSVIGRDVTIGKNATVKDSVVFSKCVIEEGAVLENVICDKQVRVRKNKVVRGTKDDPYIVKQEETI